MASSIDINVPTAGLPTTLSVRQNFEAAKSEIEAIQNQLDPVRLTTKYVSDYASLTTAVAAIGATPTVLYINEATTCTADTTIPATLQIVDEGGTVDNGGKVLTINGVFLVGKHQFFTGASGTITFPDGTLVNAEWWPDLDTALGLLGTASQVVVQVNDSTSLASTKVTAASFEGAGVVNVAAGGHIIITNTSADRAYIRGVHFVGDGVTVATLDDREAPRPLVKLKDCYNVTIDDASFSTSQDGIAIDNATNVKITKSRFKTINDYGVIAYNSTTQLSVLNSKFEDIGASSTTANPVALAGYGQWSGSAEVYDGTTDLYDIDYSHNKFVNPGFSAIVVGGSSWERGVRTSHRVKANDNTIQGISQTNGIAISFYGVEDFEQIGNIVNVGSTNMLYGLEGSYVHRGQIANNVVYKNSTGGLDTGISVSDDGYASNTVAIEGNTILNATTGIQPEGSELTVAANKIIADAIGVRPKRCSRLSILSNDIKTTVATASYVPIAIDNTGGTGTYDAVIQGNNLKSANSVVISLSDNTPGQTSAKISHNEQNGGTINKGGDSIPIYRDAELTSSSLTTMRVKYLTATATDGQPTMTLTVDWAGRSSNTPYGGTFSLGWGTNNDYDANPGGGQFGGAMAINGAALDGSGFPYWDLDFPVTLTDATLKIRQGGEESIKWDISIL